MLNFFTKYKTSENKLPEFCRFIVIINIHPTLKGPLFFFIFLVQKLRQELLSRQGSVDATRDSVSKLLHTSDASTASGLQGSLEDLTQRFTAAQASQAEREAELKGLLPKLESYERLGSDLQVFTQSRVKALSPVGQPDRSVDDYRQTIEVSRVDRFSLIGQWIGHTVALSNIFVCVCFLRRSDRSWNRKPGS